MKLITKDRNYAWEKSTWNSVHNKFDINFTSIKENVLWIFHIIVLTFWCILSATWYFTYLIFTHRTHWQSFELQSKASKFSFIITRNIIRGGGNHRGVKSAKYSHTFMTTRNLNFYLIILWIILQKNQFQSCLLNGDVCNVITRLRIFTRIGTHFYAKLVIK